MTIEYDKELKATETGIPGLVVVDLPVHGDSRGWFKENYQREKMIALGIPDRRWIQNNLSFNEKAGTTRGIHAEPWNKFISIATGSVFGAWVDLRCGSKTYGKVFTCILDSSKAIYVPRGVGNSYQALEDGTTYIYLVDSHWSAEAKKTYTFVNLADPDLAIDWPIPLDECEVSEADRNHPFFEDVVPMAPKRILVTGCNGQLGRAVRKLTEERGLADLFDFHDIDTFDFSNPDSYTDIDWSVYGIVINCGAYTAVDRAETQEGRVAAWRANATGPALLSKVCAERGIVLVHISSDYVFDGTQEIYGEDEPFSPLSVYGASKAAGDLAVSTCPKYYILRSSWVIGDGSNFVRTMMKLSDRCADPDDELDEVTVVNDQIGRLTFADDMARAIFWLLGYRDGDIEPSSPVPFGTYNYTCSGEPASWTDVAWEVFELANGNASCVRPVSTKEYCANAHAITASRPKHSVLDLSKIKAKGLRSKDWESGLSGFMNVYEVRVGE